MGMSEFFRCWVEQMRPVAPLTMMPRVWVGMDLPVIASEAKQAKVTCRRVTVWIACFAPRKQERSAVKQPCVYMMASKRNGTLYTGVTSNLPGRAFQHREGLIKGFTAKYGCKLLVWYELHESMY